MRLGADERRRLGIHQQLQHRGQQPAHQLATIGASHHIKQFQQGRLIQSHRVNPFREFLGGYSQSLTRWLLTVGDRHGHHDEEPDLHHPAGLSLFERR